MLEQNENRRCDGVRLAVSTYNQDFLERIALVYGCEPSDILNIDPLKPDPPRLVYDRLRAANKDVQDRAMAVLDALLKAG